MELKLIDNVTVYREELSFNRTTMELKRALVDNKEMGLKAF